MEERITQFVHVRGDTIRLAEKVVAIREEDGRKEDNSRYKSDWYDNIVWNIGHVLVLWDHGLFPKLGLNWLLPERYHIMFPAGTSPGNWKFDPPSVQELIVRLRAQEEQVMEMASRHLDYPLVEPFGELVRVGEVFEVLMNEERLKMAGLRRIVLHEQARLD